MARPSPSSRPRRRLRVAVAVALALAGVTGVVTAGRTPAGAQETEAIDDPRLDPSLAGVQVQSDGYGKARAAYRAAASELADAEARLAALVETVGSLTTERERLLAEIAEARAVGDAARGDLTRHQRSLRTLAVESYVKGRGGGTEDLAGGASAAAEASRADAMVNDVARRRTDQVRAARRTIEETDATIAEDEEALATASSRLEEATKERDDTTEEVTSRRDAAEGARRSMNDWRLAADVTGSDLPLVALDAYVKAANAMAAERPGCGLRWSGLAGIGKVESGHGTYGGARLTATGDTSKPIVGIPLDGTNGTAVVGDTDGGRWDGDPTVDRAVGPMQFIPGSWATLGRDGNGDGVADPSNIYDAALAAGGLLCRAGGSGLDTDAGLYRAALGYNNSASYAALVVRTANAYQAREAELIPPPPPPPTTTTTPAPTPVPSAPTPTTEPAGATAG